MTLSPLVLEGSPGARGEQFGRARAGQISDWLIAWMGSIARAGIEDPKLHVGRMIHETGFCSAIEKYAPDLLEEVQGIAKGAALPADILLSGQMMDEEWEHRKRTTGAKKPGKCSSFAVHEGNVCWMGQNMDLDPSTAGHQLVLRLGSYAKDPAVTLFTVGGMIGLMGVNSAGLCVCVNALPEVAGSPEGLPVAFMIRKSLQQSGAAAAADLLCSLPHATPQHYLVGDACGFHSIEATPLGTFRYSSEDPNRLFHTNHALAFRTLPQSTAYYANSVGRLRALNEATAGKTPSLALFAAALASRAGPHPICRVARDDTRSWDVVTSFTTGAMIAELGQDSALRAWICIGPPSMSRFERI